MTHELPLPTVDGVLCVGYGLCHDHASRYLEMDDEGITRVRDGLTGIPAHAAPSIEAAMEACPAAAITWAR
jgi:ferredoxin